MKRLHAVLAAAAMMSAFHPATARAGTTTMRYDLATRQTDSESAGEYDGRLRMTVSGDGIVAGTFMNTEGDIMDVTGGLTGTKIWLDLHAASPGTSGVFTGSFSNGRLLATRSRGFHRLTLQGSPAAH